MNKEYNDLKGRRQKFVDAYVLTGNGSEAARRSGYSEKAARVTASKLLTNANVSAAIAYRQAEYAEELRITKDDIFSCLLSAIQMGREQQNPAVMIQGCVQLAKLLGFYEPETVKVDLGADSGNLKAKFAAMTDDELLAIASGVSSQVAGG
jgi:hypothetical protein